jgi:hypothetical protein
MNYYEELGIRPDADEEEIRKAHRRLVKLMHPDQHRDAGLKALAETQMRRLNSIVATLLDPEERQEYDEQLRGGGSDSAHAGSQKSNWQAVPWWIASTLGAIVLTVGTLWFFADRMGPATHPAPKVDISEDPLRTPPNVVKPPVKIPDPEPQQKPVEDTTLVQVHPTAPPTPSPESIPTAPPTPTQAALKKPEAAPSQVTKPNVAAATKLTPTSLPKPTLPEPTKSAVTAVPKNVPTPPPAIQKPRTYQGQIVPPLPVQKKGDILIATNAPNPANGEVYAGDIPRPEYTPPPPPKPLSRMKNDPLEGEWVYAPTSPEKPRAGIFPPEFIDLKLTKDSSGMKGEYSARYNVNRPVSPDVNFELVATDQSAMKYQWKGPNGAYGWLEIKDLETDTMRLVWKDTSKHGSDRLASGQATLVRKN